jgi:phosphomevalonate kinase
VTRRTRAPGKLLLSGAYAVLEGAPAIVCAIDRYAHAFDAVVGTSQAATVGEAPAEVRALERPCAVDVRELEQDGMKLGLGSSAAALVAAMALRAVESGEDPTSDRVRRTIFVGAREVHARVQGGGSGVDVAASTFGGVLRYDRDGVVEPVELPPEIHITAFFSGKSARTSELRGRVEALRERDPSTYRARMALLAEIARDASRAIAGKDGASFVAAIRRSLAALAALGSAADAPIVLPLFAELGAMAVVEQAAFIPSGAGGGDIGVFVGTAVPSVSFMRHAEHVGMAHVPLGIDSRGVHVTS